MAISFESIGNPRVPFAYIEFSNASASQGPSVQPYKVLAMGQKLAAGSEPELTFKTVTSEAQAISLYGQGSHLARMVKSYLDNNLVTELVCVAIDDAGAAADAAGKITLATSTATEDGTLQVYIAGQRISVGVSSGDDQDAVIAALVAQITAQPDLPVSAAVNGSNANECDLTAKNGGLLGNEIDIRLNYFSDDVTPAGLGAITITDMAGGTTNPDISEIIAVLPEDQFNLIINPWTDSANLIALEAQLLERFGPNVQNDGYAISAKLDSLANLQSLGNGRNSQFTSIFGPAASGPSAPWEYAASIVGQIAKAAQASPARPFQTLQAVGILPPTSAEQFTMSEREILLSDGIATMKVDSGGASRIERAITTYQTNAAGQASTAYLDLNTLLTLSFLRYDFRTQMLSKFPRFSLASDNVRVAPGLAILTPLTAKAEAVRIFSGWEELGLVEDLDQFQTDLIVEINAQDPNRLDFQLKPNLVNQLRVLGTQIQFIL